MRDGYSLADIGAVTRNNNDGFGDGNGWWILIILFALFGGWGNNGFGGNGSNGALTRGDLCQDMNFNDLQNAVRTLQSNQDAGFRTIDNAICTLGYNNAQLANGIQMQISNEFRGLDNAVCTLGYNTQQGFNALATQIANCCCTVERAIDGVNYNMSQNTCAITNAINNVYNQLHNEIVANRIEDKNAQITAQQNEINSLRLAASQCAQNQYLVEQLSPKCPIPAFLTCNPYTGQSFTNGFAYGNGCGCGNY